MKEIDFLRNEKIIEMQPLEVVTHTPDSAPRPQRDPLTPPKSGDYTDSGAFDDAVREHQQAIFDNKVQKTAGCLALDVQLYGVTSATPSVCPVEGCSVTSSKATLRVDGDTKCLSPLYEPRDKYTLNKHA